MARVMHRSTPKIFVCPFLCCLLVGPQLLPKRNLQAFYEMSVLAHWHLYLFAAASLFGNAFAVNLSWPVSDNERQAVTLCSTSGLTLPAHCTSSSPLPRNTSVNTELLFSCSTGYVARALSDLILDTGPPPLASSAAFRITCLPNGNFSYSIGSMPACAPVCGDGRLTAADNMPMYYAFGQCDDGNRFDGDGCSSKCEAFRWVVFLFLNPHIQIVSMTLTLRCCALRSCS